MRTEGWTDGVNVASPSAGLGLFLKRSAPTPVRNKHQSAQTQIVVV